MTTLLKSASDIKILIVDDTPDNLRLLARILETQHYTVLKALNARMALQVVHRKLPDLILLDINLPETNGFEICQQLKSSDITAHIPVIFISALNEPADKVQAFAMGGQDYITKPFQELEVLARVQNHLLIRQQQQQLQQEIQERRRAEAEAWRLNLHLERQIQSRTLELQQALSAELALKHVTDQVRDSLDQHQIMQTTVETLAWALEGDCCEAALYSKDHTSSVIRYQWTRPGLEETQGQILYMTDFPELYEQLQSRVCFALCQIQPNPIRHHGAILACPIFDETVDQTGILGDLWIFRDTHSSFGEVEIRLVQQVANQCAIALRQARLYEAAQKQVQELARLNQLKDDFLNTISHELRTPLASMKMLMNLINQLLQPGNDEFKIAAQLPSNQQVTEYLELLQKECDVELKLVEDLLILQQLEAGTYVPQAITMNLHDLLLHLIEPFEARIEGQQQILDMKISPDLPMVTVDSLAIKRVVMELLNNACKYTPKGGTISISASPVVNVSTASDTNEVEIKIANTGVEISAQEFSRVFDKFYRIPNNDPWKHGGTGLGLALIKKLVEHMDGTISVTSAANQTCFSVVFSIKRGNCSFFDRAD